MMDFALAQADAGRIPLPDRSVDMVFGSPPYTDCRTYGRKDVARGTEAWIEWMLRVTAEAQRVSRGPVLWVAAGPTRGRNYQPACEGLMYRWWQRGGDCHLYRPCYWHRFGIPGSGGNQWFRADVEMVLAFKRPGPLPWSDNTAMGHPPMWAPGGAMSHRLGNRKRTQWGGSEKSGGHRTADGSKVAFVRPSHVIQSNGDERASNPYSPPVLANPGNLISTGAAGGGNIGHRLAHENEAPFPEALAEFFVRSLCPPGGLCLDPFSGSGTTVSVALAHGRRGIGLDLRDSQCDLGRRRIVDQHFVTDPGRPGPQPSGGPPQEESRWYILLVDRTRFGQVWAWAGAGRKTTRLGRAVPFDSEAEAIATLARIWGPDAAAGGPIPARYVPRVERCPAPLPRRPIRLATRLATPYGPVRLRPGERCLFPEEVMP